MKRKSLSLVLVAAASGGIAAVGACSGDGSGGGTKTTGSSDASADVSAPLEAGTDAGSVPYSIQVPCTDSPESVYGDPGTLPTTAGAIIKCAHYEDISSAALLSQAQAPDYPEDGGFTLAGYSGPPFPSGAHVYRVLYRTERGNPNNTPGYSSALVFIPDAPRAGRSPIIVASHGSRGQAPSCAPSTDNDAGAYVEGDFKRQVYPLVGAGYVVIASDLAGYANFGAANNPPSAYADVADVGKSTLDAARALKALLGPSMLEQVVLVGHSQGGGTALGALALASTYAPELNIAGVAVYSPLWISARVNGAFLTVASDFPLATSPEGPVSVWYLYTHAELLDGPGHGLDPFAPDAQAAVLSFVNNDCYARTYPVLNAVGPILTDVVATTFTSAVAQVAANFPANVTCSETKYTSDPTLCTTWLQRFEADWPHLTGTAAQVPILSLYGADDQTIPPDFAACIFDRYKADHANVTVCIQPDAGHSSLVSQRADYVNQWVDALIFDGGQPAPCQYNQNNLVYNDAMVLDLSDDAGTPVGCSVLIPPN